MKNKKIFSKHECQLDKTIDEQTKRHKERNEYAKNKMEGRLRYWREAKYACAYPKPWGGPGRSTWTFKGRQGHIGTGTLFYRTFLTVSL